MKLRYSQSDRLFDVREPSKGFVSSIKSIDNALEVAFNRLSGKWEIYRKSQGTYHWILNIENDDESYRPLDQRTIKKLYEMDILRRFGSAKKYEQYLDNKVKEWRAKQDKQDNEDEIRRFKQDKFLWQRAAENAASGIVNDPPEQKSKTIMSYQKEAI